MPLAESDIAALLKLDDASLDARIAEKLKKHIPLTRAERARLAQARAGGSADAPSSFAQTWDELADRLHVSRKTVQNWRAREDLKPFPKDRADGRHDVAAWAAFMVERALARADETAPLSGESDDSSERPRTIRDWKARLEELKCQRLEQKIGVEAGELTPTADIEIALGQLLISFRASLDHLPPSAARWVRGLTDFHAIVERLQAECDALLHGLYRADYLADVLPGIVATLPPPEGIAAEPWQNALTAATSNVLRAIGRLALPTSSPAKTAVQCESQTIVTAVPGTAASEPTPLPDLSPAAFPAPADKSPRPRSQEASRVRKKKAPAKPAKPSRKRKPRDDEATAHAELKPTLAERARKARARRKR